MEYVLVLYDRVFLDQISMVRPKTKRTAKRKPRRRRPAANAIREIKKYQASGDLLLPNAPCQLLVREVVQERMNDLRIQKEAFEVLQQAAENHLVEVLTAANLIAHHAKRITLKRADVRVVRWLKPKHNFNF